MRIRTIATFAIAAATMFAAAPKPASYAGKWTLDRAQSTNLPRMYEHVTGHTLDISQTATDLNVGVTITAETHDPENFLFAYRLDGTPTKAQTHIRTPQGPADVPTTLKAQVNADGTMTITIDRELPFGPQPVHGVTVETWKLDEKGNKLTIHRADDTPRGKFECDMVFVRG